MKSRDENGNGNEDFDGLGRKPNPLHRTKKQSKRMADGKGGDEAPQPARLLDLCLKFSQDFVTWEISARRPLKMRGNQPRRRTVPVESTLPSAAE